MTVLVLVETVVLAVLTVLVAGLLRAYGTVLRRLHELDGGGRRQFELRPVATGERPAPAASEDVGPAHDIAGETLRGEFVSARITGVEHDTLLLFLSSGCASCAAFWDELAVPNGLALPAHTRLIVVAQSAADESPGALADLAPAGVDVVLSSDAWRDYAVPGSPHVVFVDGPAGRVRGEGTGQSFRQVAELLARSTGDARLVTGEPLPKSGRDRRQEAAVDRELLAAGILPGDPRLYEDQAAQ
jgi:hypothetical protein